MSEPTSPSTPAEKPQWADDFPQLDGLDAQTWKHLSTRVIQERFRQGESIFREGDPCGAYVLLRRGRIKVVKQWSNGRAITLYRVESGSSCSASTALLFAHGSYSADAVAETDCELVLLPRADFTDLFEKSDRFRSQVCREFGGRLAGLTRRLDAALFRPVDARLADWLIENQSADGSIRVTHQDLAVELGSVREVVSRHLKKMETEGCIALSRGKIQVVDEERLLEIAGSMPSAAQGAPAGELLTPSRIPMHSIDPASWTAEVPALNDIDDEVWRYVASRAQIVEVPAGARPFSVGDPCGQYILVKHGAVRVSASLTNGKEFLLYRLGPGEACCASASGVLRREEHVTNAIAEQDTEAVLISDRDFHHAFHQSPAFRTFVVASYEARIQQLLELLEALLVESVEVRLARCLLRHAEQSPQINVSHEELASEVGTAREVVSRHLKTWEKQGVLRLARRQVEVVDLLPFIALLPEAPSQSNFVTDPD